jgi:hypothetical protein
MMNGGHRARGSKWLTPTAVRLSILLVLTAVGLLTLELVKSKASWIVKDTLHGLSAASIHDSSLAADFSRILMACTDPSAEERAKTLGDEAHYEAKLRRSLVDYEDSLYVDVDRRNFQHLIETRKGYVEARQNVLDLLVQNKIAEARAASTETLLPAYTSYMGAGKVLLDYNIAMGEERGGRIMAFCKYGRYVIAVVVVAIFALGFFTGYTK